MGFLSGISGRELAGRAYAQAEKFGAQMLLRTAHIGPKRRDLCLPWETAAVKGDESQRKLDLQFFLVANPDLRASVPSPEMTIRPLIDTYINRKESESVTPSIIREPKYQLGLFDEFLAKRGKFLPSEITPTDVIQFRASWTDW